MLPGHKQVSEHTELLFLPQLLCCWFRGENDAIPSCLRWRGLPWDTHSSFSSVRSGPLAFPRQSQGKKLLRLCPQKLFRPKGPAQPQAALRLLLKLPHCRNLMPFTALLRVPTPGSPWGVRLLVSAQAPCSGS